MTATAAAAVPADAAAPARPRKKRRLMLILFTLLLVAGGGVGGGLYATGGLGHGGSAEDAHLPQLVVKPGVSSAEAEAARGRARAGRPDPRIFQPTYVPLEANFTSNLRGGDSFVQISLGVSTFYGAPVVANLETHEMAVRSAVLLTLSEQDPVEITTISGKQALKEQLKKAINDVLTIKEGFGGIDDVYFTSFVTQ
jgi:flagellar protein FliL